MEYIEIDLDCGLSIIDSVKLLHSKAEATDKNILENLMVTN